MAENEDGQEKKHAPSEKKWEDAAEKGQTPKSQDVNAAVVLLIGGLVLANGNALVVLAFRRSLVGSMKSLPVTTMDLQSAQELAFTTMQTIGIAVAVPLLAVMVAATLANLAQTGMRTAPKALEPDINRLNALSNAKQQYMSWTPLVELGKGLAKVLAVSGGALLGVWNDLDQVAGLSLVAVEEMPVLLGTLTVRLLLGAIPVVIVIAGADYAYTVWRMTEQLKRTDKELKDEQKDVDGDPHMKARRKQMARQMLFSGSMKAVTEADVVVTNPTHFAVALRYRRGRDVAPVVVAKGVDAGAKRIREAARDARVPLVENRPLARQLWKVAKVDRPIPEDLYGPVARVLAVVWARKRKRR
ncbi:MAG: EscU/YscU/HrcU family type III secretion system export apparatus switch protein [Myxococcales bacterium]|nr:EscU/YscU/HrcU family type III secretion system export apparatus switch protein [Myxococcales bacterium]MCA9567093.1 EscU/YscU/HrcU family type III secretion system export apparatus switch protein [Myxococcales bacterium]